MPKDILKINFSGASSTGKSTICEYCSHLYNEPCAIERMREVMIKNGIDISGIKNETFLEAAALQQEDIIRMHNLAKRYIFIDSGPLIFYLGNKYSFGRDFPTLKHMALDFYKEQDVVFLCDNHIKFDNSIMRGDDGTKDILQKEIIEFLNQHNIDYIELKGNIAERAETVKSSLIKTEQRKSLIQAKFNQLPVALNKIAAAYNETDVSIKDKEIAIERLHNSRSLADDSNNTQLVRELRKLIQSNVLSEHFEIKNFELFKKSNLVRYAAGLGPYRNLAQTSAMKQSNLVFPSCKKKSR